MDDLVYPVWRAGLIYFGVPSAGLWVALLLVVLLPRFWLQSA